MSEDNEEFGLIVSFDDQSHSYVHGFEAGMIWQRMQAGAEAEIDTLIHTVNTETVRRMAVAEGWDAKFTVTEVEEWSTVFMEKKRKPTGRSNPLGLSVVN